MSLPLPSTFMPLPLPMMIPFMGIQSGVMALMFGQNFQFGKRKISAMSNEEFNELTFEKLMQQNLSTLKGLIPTFEKSLADMRPFTEFIIREFGVMITQLIGQTGNQFDKAAQTAQDDFYHFMGWGHAPTSYHQDGTLHAGATEDLPPPFPEPEPDPDTEPPTEEPPTTGTILTIQWNPPIAGGSKTFVTLPLTKTEHQNKLNTMQADLGLAQTVLGFPYGTTDLNVFFSAYQSKIDLII